MANEKKFSKTISCGHCTNKAPHEIVARYSQVETCEGPDGPPWDAGNIFDLLLCPACHDISLKKSFWSDDNPDEISNEKVLYPVADKTPKGMPAKLKAAYQAAIRVKSIDPNAFGVLLGRLLELVCIDRNAKGKTLNEGLTDLATRGEIPGKLIAVANGLKNLRNIGAHPILGELTPVEVPVLEGLSRAILEYVYSAPYLAQQAEESLAHLKQPKK